MTTTITPSAAGLRTLAHPTRLAILGLLRTEGPSTATALAARLNLNTGATSYHLRQLARHGFVVEDAARGDRRDRWWRAAHEATETPESAESDDEADALEGYLHTVALRYTEILVQHAAERRSLPIAWQEASSLSDWSRRLTPGRARELIDAVTALVASWPDDDGPEAAGDVMVNLNVFVRPGTEARDEPADGTD